MPFTCDRAAFARGARNEVAADDLRSDAPVTWTLPAWGTAAAHVAVDFQQAEPAGGNIRLFGHRSGGDAGFERFDWTSDAMAIH